MPPTIEKLFTNLIMPVQSTILPKIEARGIYVVPEHVNKARIEIDKYLPEARSNILKHVPKDFVIPAKSKKALKAGFNPGSPKQLGALLFDTLKLPDNYGRSTREQALIEIQERHEIVKAILEYRKWHKFDDTFITPWMDLRDKNGFIHPHFRFIPVTGRLSSSDPNLQQVPRDPLIRYCIGAPPGYQLLACDLSQIEMVLAADDSGDPVLLEIFHAGKDVHWITVLEVLSQGGSKDIEDLARETVGIYLHRQQYGKEVAIPPSPRSYTEKYTFKELINIMLTIGMKAVPEKVSAWKDLRKKAKAVNFGLIYGMGAEGLQEYCKVKYGIEITLDESYSLRDAYFRKYAGLLPWHQRRREEVRKNHYVTSKIGRIRHLNNILSRDEEIVAEAERQAINSPIQGLGSDIPLMACIEIDKRLSPPEGWICGLVHDCLMAIVRDDLVPYWIEEIPKVINNPPWHLFDARPVQVPITCEITADRGWV